MKILLLSDTHGELDIINSLVEDTSADYALLTESEGRIAIDTHAQQ